MNILKKSLSIILATVLIMSLVACGKGAELEAQEATPDMSETGVIPDTNTDTDTANDTVDNSKVITVQVENREEAYPFSVGTLIKSIARSASSLLILGTDDDGAYLGICDYTLESGQPRLGETQPLNIAELPFDGTPICYAVTAGGDGYFYILFGNNVNNASTMLTIQKYSNSGEYIECMSILDWELMTVDCFSVGAEGEVLLATDSTVCIYRWLGDLINRSDGDYRVYSSSASGMGLVLSTFSLTDHSGYYYLINSETGDLLPLPLSAEEPSGDKTLLVYRVCGSIAHCQGLNGEYLMNDGRSICQIDFQNDNVSPLIDWNPDYQYDNEIGAACRLGENAFACIVDNRLILAWTQTVEKRESGIVRIGVVGLVSHKTAKTVEHMNTADCPYIFETTIFASDEQELNRFRAELMSGAFDLIVFHDEINTVGSAFEDLYPYIDSDEELSRESFIPNFLNSLSVHGELHQMWNSAMISTMVAREDVVGDNRGLTIRDCEQLVAEKPDIQSVLDNKFSDENALKQDVLQNIASVAATAFVDTENASCSFASEEFMGLLSLCDRIHANPDSTGRDFLLYSESVVGAESLPYIENTLGSCSFVGYPDGADGIHYYFFPNDFEHCMSVAIPTNSLNKQGAWQFIKMMLSRKSQLNIANSFGSGFPVIYDIVKETSERTVDAQSAAKFYDLLTRTKSAELYSDNILRNIIIECGQAYLAGDKTLDETANAIQSRVSIYLAEQYG